MTTTDDAIKIVYVERQDGICDRWDNVGATYNYDKGSVEIYRPGDTAATVGYYAPGSWIVFYTEADRPRRIPRYKQ
jgi:hypothetical protein